MKYRITVCVFGLLFIGGNINSAELKDPRLRDEDISASLISVDYFTRPDGLIEYVYSITSPLENKGEITRMLLDLSCSASFDFVNLPYADGMPGYSNAAVSLGIAAHTPTAIHADYGSAYSYAITVNGEALWGIGVLPGASTTGLRLISAAEPGMRTYGVEPWMDNDETWDYPEAGDPDIPWIQDFTVTGLIAAPGCPGVTEAPDSDFRFDGMPSHKNAAEDNRLLSYSTPLRDRLHVEAGTNEMTIHIFYSEDIDARTFKVKPESLKSRFNPEPGSDELVTIPLNKKRTKFEFSIESTDIDKKSKGEYKDKDIFEIRVENLR